MRLGLRRLDRALRRLAVARNRLEADRARSDTRDWALARRARTRHLIELGGLVAKAGLVELTDDDRATMLGVGPGCAPLLLTARPPRRLA
jgi:hypothetical protein